MGNKKNNNMKLSNTFPNSNLFKEIQQQVNDIEKLKLHIYNYKINDNLFKLIDSSTNNIYPIINNLIPNYKIIENITNPLITVINQIAESQKAMMDIIMTSVNNPFFISLSNALEEAKKNPNSVYNWFDYYDKLSEFFWIMPYKMTPEDLNNILSNIKSEKEFDKYIVKYFNNHKVNSLITDIESMFVKKQDLKFFKQVELAYSNKSYSLVIAGLVSIIDNLLSYYLINKGCTKRLKIFEPIIEDLNIKQDSYNDFIFIVMMINSNINLLYEDIEFNETIKIKTNKKARRNPVSHGKLYSNKKIDAIMLLNTLFYLLIAKDELKEYRNSLCYNRRKRKFYIPCETEKKKIKKTIKENISKKKNQKVR